MVAGYVPEGVTFTSVRCMYVPIIDIQFCNILPGVVD